MTDPIVLPDAPEAASLMTVTGWVSRRGIFYGDKEGAARYDGCTHVTCKTCGKPTEKPWTMCPECRETRDAEGYRAMPAVPWDGVAMVYSDVREEYYNSLEDAEDSLKEGETLADLRLILCEANYGRPLGEDYFSDDLPEDGDLPAVLVEAIAAFNKALESAPPLSWSPGKFAILLEPEQGVAPIGAAG